MKCKTCGHEIEENKIRDFGYAKFEITTPIQISSYEEAKKKCPEGFKIPLLSELIKLVELGFFDNIEKGKFRYFLSSIKYKSGVGRLYRDSGGSWYASWSGGLDYFGEDCRVVYIREVSND